MQLKVSDILTRLIGQRADESAGSDGLKFGDPNEEVRGIVTAFMPTFEVLKQTAALGANVLIAHEGIFFSHNDSFSSKLVDDPVYLEKLQFIQDNRLHVIRYHDNAHLEQPDLITNGLIDALDWQHFLIKHTQIAATMKISPATVKEIADHIKGKLGVKYVRVVGDLDMICSRVGITVGYRGGGMLSLPLFKEEELDLILCGEGPEWETPEYVRDAVCQGRTKALIILGHAESEDPGMKALAVNLQQQFLDIPVNHLSNEPMFKVI